MDYNYHTHTYRCHHATGTEREYVERAVANGIKYMGFSEHMPFMFPDGHQSHYRMWVEDVKSYFDILNNLREEFKDKVEIKIGFEMECYPKYFDEMIEKAIEYGAEYLLLGHHYLNNEEGKITSTSKHTNANELNEYTDSIIHGIKSGFFTYVAHPDIFNFIGDDKIYEESARKICKASNKYDVPLEINFVGIRRKRHYPNEKFLKIAGEEQSKIVFGFDAHDKEAAYDGESLIIAEGLLDKYKLNYIGRPEIVPLVKKHK